jgi:hypothetical protein
VNQVLSLADHTAWAGQAVLLLAPQSVLDTAESDNEGDFDPDVPIRWGRRSYLKDTVADAGPPEVFPPHGPQGSGDQLFAYFHKTFGLLREEIVTTMGVHTFGTQQCNWLSEAGQVRSDFA